MKKLVLAVIAVAALTIAISANAADEKYVAGGFEASGHVNAGLGFDYVGANSANASGAAGLSRDAWANSKFYDKAKNFGFLLDEVELNITKSFGENVKARTDIAFGDNAIGSAWAGAYLKQAYVTANIAVGNGIEWLFGRFDAPVGYEARDRNDNNTVTHSMIYNYNIRPRSLTGMKFYYAFSDAVDWHVWFANNMMDDFVNVGTGWWNWDNKIMPAIGTRVGYTWGEEGTESTIGLSGAISPEVNYGSKLGNMSFFADLDWNIWATDSFVIGGEGIYRQNNAAQPGGTATKLFGGILDLNYVFSDVWDGTIKYAILYNMKNGQGVADGTEFRGYSPSVSAAAQAGGACPTFGTGTKGYLQEISIAPGYQIADGAKFRAEGRLDWTKYSGLTKNMTWTAIGMFEYTF